MDQIRYISGVLGKPLRHSDDVLEKNDGWWVDPGREVKIYEMYMQI